MTDLHLTTLQPDALSTVKEIKRICSQPFRTDAEPGRVAIARLAIIERFAERALGLEISPISDDGPTGNWAIWRDEQ